MKKSEAEIGATDYGYGNAIALSLANLNNSCSEREDFWVSYFRENIERNDGY